MEGLARRLCLFGTGLALLAGAGIWGLALALGPREGSFLLAAPAALLVLGAVALWIAARIARPVSRLADAAEAYCRHLAEGGRMLVTVAGAMATVERGAGISSDASTVRPSS